MVIDGHEQGGVGETKQRLVMVHHEFCLCGCFGDAVGIVCKCEVCPLNCWLFVGTRVVVLCECLQRHHPEAFLCALATRHNYLSAERDMTTDVGHFDLASCIA